MRRLMSRGKNLAIVPGGFEEATLQRYSDESVYLSRRKGFIKIALKHGYAVTPVYTFGESETFHTLTGANAFRLWLNSFKLPAVIFFGWTWFPFFPRPESELHTFIGDPIQLPLIPEATSADVDKWHKVYVEALVKLFDRHKAQVAGKESATLNVL